MTTLTELITAIAEEIDLSTRCNDFIYASARRTDANDHINAVALLDEAIALLRDNVNIRDDNLISQVAFEFVRMGQMNRAGTAVNFIADASIKNEALSRMAIERAKKSAQDANNIAQAITTETVKNETLGQVAVNVAIAGNMTMARTIASTISDTNYRATMDKECRREASKGL